MKVAGLDLSLAATGAADVTGMLHLLRTKATAYQAFDERLTRLRSISAACVTVTRGADLVVIEGPSLGQGQQAGVVDRSGLWWMVYDSLDQAGRRCIVLPPTTLKKYATGKGNAGKPDMRVALLQRTGVDVRDDNQVDAAWLRFAGLEIVGEPLVAMPALNRGALSAWRS